MNELITTELTSKNVFRIAHKFTTLKGSEWKPNEIDFLFSFISEIRKDDDKFKFYELTRSQLSKKMKRRLEKARIIELFDNMLNKQIKIETNKEIKHYNIFATLIYNKVDDAFKVKFNDDIKYLLLQIKPFTQGYLSDLFKLESVYSKKLYLLLAKNLNIVKFKISVEDLMNELEVTKSYRRYDNFKRKVLEVTKKACLKNQTKLQFEFEEVKDRKKVTHLIFNIWQIMQEEQEENKNQNKQVAFVEQTDSEKELIKPYLNRKVCIDNEIYFIKDIFLNKDTKHKDYNKYVLELYDSDKIVYRLQLQNIDVRVALEYIQKNYMRD